MHSIYPDIFTGFIGGYWGFLLPRRSGNLYRVETRSMVTIPAGGCVKHQCFLFPIMSYHPPSTSLHTAQHYEPALGTVSTYWPASTITYHYPIDQYILIKIINDLSIDRYHPSMIMMLAVLLMAHMASVASLFRFAVFTTACWSV